MKKLYLHIGAGKTGSSALQVWLHDNSDNLLKQNIYYPVYQEIKNEYEITSGNGVVLFNALKNNNLDEFFDTYLTKEKVFFSSEVFQSLNENELFLLKEKALKRGYEVEIIIYLRDIYDIVYSSYQQLIKRHLYSESFDYFVKNLRNLQQFVVLKKFENIFDKINVIHYDAVKEKGIEKPILEILNLKDMTELKKKKVNRSLSLYESELLKNMNKFYKKYLNEKDYIFSTTISNNLIYSNPEKETEIYFNESLLSLMKEKFSKDVNRINKIYKINLGFFNKKDKKITKKIPSVEKEFLIVMEGLFNYFTSKREIVKEKEKKVDLISLLVNESKKRREKNIDDAIHILKTAKILRPEGKRLEHLLHEMEKDKTKKGNNNVFKK